jgi:glutamate dehydrogenase/leucine dehydrogenase
LRRVAFGARVAVQGFGAVGRHGALLAEKGRSLSQRRIQRHDRDQAGSTSRRWSS